MKRTVSLLLAILLAFSLLTGCTGIGGKENSSQTTSNTQESEDSTEYIYGYIGDKMSNVFFDFTVDEVWVSEAYEVAAGSLLLDVTVTMTNTFGEDLPMFNGDFFLSYGDEDEDYCFGLLPEGDTNPDNMPESWTLKKGNTVTYHLYYEIPEDATEFYFVYVEYFENDSFGDYYCVSFTM